jgi:hypothetical protein
MTPQVIGYLNRVLLIDEHTHYKIIHYSQKTIFKYQVLSHALGIIYFAEGIASFYSSGSEIDIKNRFFYL